MTQRSMMGLVRKGKTKIRGTCFLVTWDIDSRNRTAVNRAQYFLFGRGSQEGGNQEAERRGFVWKDGVRYIAQSALFVLPHRAEEIRRFLKGNGIDHETESVLVP